ncbi:SREBP regulating gene protein isoform X1 [Diachasmimorpha longicaudata]|uniref:SREBP regulating gene protein isoform X1 n=1 Tax=Diachasmimorpha longicaudata TaxID=58733 RepID=UPI0030B8ED5F
MRLAATWSGLVRLLRRRIVLALIFALSLTYCAISLLAHEKIDSPVGNYGDDGDDSMLIDNDDIGADQDSDDDLGGKHIPWPAMSASDDAGLDQNHNGSSVSEVARTCRNSIQGKALIVDERGLVCARKEVLPGGCCRGDLEKTETTGVITLVKRERYSCETCNPEGCCAVYEYCVSCCLHPGKRRPKKEPHASPVRREAQKSRRTEDTVKIRFRSLDRFQICLAICRTSSASVRHENTYKDPNSKHCYVNSMNHRSPRDVNNNINNNGDNVAVTSSTVRLFILHYPNPESLSIDHEKCIELYDYYWLP